MSSFRWRDIIACLLAAGSSLASIAAQTRPIEKNHSLSGQILDALTGRPVTDVELALSTAKWEPQPVPGSPDSKGQLFFNVLRRPNTFLSRSGRTSAQSY